MLALQALGLAPPGQPHTSLDEARNGEGTSVPYVRNEERDKPYDTSKHDQGYAAYGEPPNILLVLSDDHGYTDLTSRIDSNVATPVLGELLRNGMHFENAYATAAQCVPSRAGLLSGRNQNTFGLWKNGVDAGFGQNTLPPRPKVTTIAEHVRDLGYTTGMAGKWHLGDVTDPNKNPGGRGFDWYFTGTLNHWHGNVRRTFDGVLVRQRDMTRTVDKRNRIDVTAEMTESFIETHKANRWFFYWAPYGPHAPMLEDGDWYLEAFRQNFQPYSFYKDFENDARLRGLALVHAIDTRMGLILGKLRSHNLEEKTLVLFSSDNGAPLGLTWDKENDYQRNVWRQEPPHPLPLPMAAAEELRFVRDPESSYMGSDNIPLRGGKGSTWEGGVKVPMLAYWKGRIAPGQTMKQTVTTLDLTATIAQAAGIRMPPAEQFDGVSLLPWLMGYTPPPRIHYQLFWHGVLGDTAVQSHGWKLRRSRETFLFDIENDPCK